MTKHTSTVAAPILWEPRVGLIRHCIHVINFSHVQNVLRVFVIYVMSRVRIFVYRPGAR